MARRAPLPTSLASLCSLLLLGGLLAGCRAQAAEAPAANAAVVDVSGVPAVTVAATSPDLVLVNGIYQFRGQPYDGFIEALYPGGAVKSLASYYRGMRHGVSKSFYEDGAPRDVRLYRANLSSGRHVGYWENGNMKFDYTYVDDRRQGLHRQWYRSGKPYTALMFKDDKEEGMQRAWRENGKPYINYEARDGFRYGLQKSALCYEIKDGAI